MADHFSTGGGTIAFSDLIAVRRKLRGFSMSSRPTLSASHHVCSGNCIYSYSTFFYSSGTVLHFRTPQTRSPRCNDTVVNTSSPTQVQKHKLWLFQISSIPQSLTTRPHALLLQTSIIIIACSSKVERCRVR